MFNNEINNTQQTKLTIDLRSNQENETFFSRCLFITSGIFICCLRNDWIAKLWVFSLLIFGTDTMIQYRIHHRTF